MLLHVYNSISWKLYFLANGFLLKLTKAASRISMVLMIIFF